MSTNVTMSILGLYKMDNTIFDNMVIPSGLSLDTLTSNILMECAELEVLYPSCDFIKWAIGKWSEKRYPEWDKVKKLYEVDLSPDNDYEYVRTVEGSRNKENTDQHLRSIDTADRKTGSDTRTNTGTVSTESESSTDSTETVNLTDTTSVSSYNASTFQNRDKVEHTGTDENETSSEDSATRTDNLNETNSYNSTLSHLGTEENSRAGNEDVEYTETITESGHKGDLAKAVKGGLEVVASIYDYICEDFKQRFCILVY